MSEVEGWSPPLDPATLMTRAEAETSIATINSTIPLFRDIKSRLPTNSSGVWTKTYPANFWTGEPSVNVNPISATVAGMISWKTTKTLTAGAWTVRVDFSLTASVLGVLTVGVSPGTVQFDYSAAEPNA